MNPSGRYLRHRVAAERARAARLRATWCFRVSAALLLCLFYLVIGRDLVAVARAKKDTAEMEIRHEAHRFSKDLESLAGAAGLASAEDPSPPALTSSAALAENGNPTDVEAMLTGQPIETCSRAR